MIRELHDNCVSRTTIENIDSGTTLSARLTRAQIVDSDTVGLATGLCGIEGACVAAEAAGEVTIGTFIDEN